jgi:hypothetical protein
MGTNTEFLPYVLAIWLIGISLDKSMTIAGIVGILLFSYLAFNRIGKQGSIYL